MNESLSSKVVSVEAKLKGASVSCQPKRVTMCTSPEDKIGSCIGRDTTSLSSNSRLTTNSGKIVIPISERTNSFNREKEFTVRVGDSLTAVILHESVTFDDVVGERVHRCERRLPVRA